LKPKTLIVIVGPTATGKTLLSIDLALEYSTEILSADSRQFYKEMNVGTAKPKMDLLLKVKHHFVDFLSINDYYNAYLYEKSGLDVLKNIFEHRDVAICVGGSGLYIKALCSGIDELPDINEKIRDKYNTLYKEKGIEVLQEILKEKDLEYYNVVDKKNPVRLIRALEVIEISGKKFSELRSGLKKKRSFNIIKIGLNGDIKDIESRIKERVKEMIKEGFIDEAIRLHRYKNLRALKAVGYPEMFEYIEGKVSLDKAIDNIVISTRQYAKRQMTWFNKDREIVWFDYNNIKGIKEYLKYYFNDHIE